MNESPNPYRPSVVPRGEGMPTDDRLTRVIVQALMKWRRTPPTILSILMNWRSLPLIVGYGVISTILLTALDAPEQLPLLVAGFCLGVASRDLGVARRSVRFWPVQNELFDWPKIEALARALGIEK
jgi:hypothetical protein